MSLVLYDGEIPNNPIVNIVLNDPLRNAIVLHNKETNEISVLKTVSQFTRENNFNFDGLQPLEVVPSRQNRRSEYRNVSVHECPNCGFILDPVNTNNNTSHTNDDSNERRENTQNDMEAFIHSNYFRLLGNGVAAHSEDGSNYGSNGQLPDSLFTQGYFDKFFKEINLLGRGARGSVYKVEHSLNGISLGFFALKKITIGDDSNWLLKVLKEVTMLCKISFNNNNLVNYNHVWLEVSSINEFGPKVPCAFILQQYCAGGNLEDFVMNLLSPNLKPAEFKKWKLKHKGENYLKGRLLTNDEILIIFNQIVLGVHELHKNHIIHRDLKPSNCLLSKPYITDFTNLEEDLTNIPTILVSDFGESQLEGEKRNATGSTGTLEYTAPELLQKGEDGRVPQFSKKTDVYSLGMILYFLCFGKLPFESQDFDVLRSEISQGSDIKLNLEATRDDLQPEIKYLIQNLISTKSEERLNTGDILQVLLNIGSIHITEQVDDTSVDEIPEMTRRLSLTDGNKPVGEGLVKNIYDHRKRILLNLISLGFLGLIDNNELFTLFVLCIGISINHDLRYTLYLTTIITLTSIILKTFNYIVH